MALNRWRFGGENLAREIAASSPPKDLVVVGSPADCWLALMMLHHRRVGRQIGLRRAGQGA